MLSPPITPWTFTPALSVGCSTRSSFPGKLANQILQWLYREDRFCHVILTVLDRTVGPANIEIPMLALVISADEIAPLTSVAPFIDKVPVKDTRIIELPSEIGVCLPHLGTLVGRTAYARVWPQTVCWLKARS
jgi:polyhydroxyalkanoate synthase subunit PhaC